MKKIYPALLALVLATAFLGGCAEKQGKIEEYLTSFSEEERDSMRVSPQQAKELLESGQAVLVDVRFAEEQSQYDVPGSIKIPLNELPARKAELPQDKIVLTTCRIGDRANMARLYLVGEGYNAKYVQGGVAEVHSLVNKGAQ